MEQSKSDRHSFESHGQIDGRTQYRRVGILEALSCELTDLRERFLRDMLYSSPIGELRKKVSDRGGDSDVRLESLDEIASRAALRPKDFAGIILDPDEPLTLRVDMVETLAEEAPKARLGEVARLIESLPEDSKTRELLHDANLVMEIRACAGPAEILKKFLTANEEDRRRIGEEVQHLGISAKDLAESTRLLRHFRLDDEGERIRARFFASLREAAELEIKEPLLFSPEGLISIVAERRSKRLDDRPVAVFILPDPKADTTQSFIDAPNEIERFIKNGYRVMVYNSKGSDLARCLLDATTQRKMQADVIVIAGHGDRTSLNLGDESRLVDRRQAQLDLTDESALTRARGALKDGGRVFLCSCSVGLGAKVPFLDHNLVNMLRRVFPQAMPGGICGPQLSYNLDCFQFGRDGLVQGIKYLRSSDRSEPGVPGYAA